MGTYSDYYNWKRMYFAIKTLSEFEGFTNHGHSIKVRYDTFKRNKQIMEMELRKDGADCKKLREEGLELFIKRCERIEGKPAFIVR